jgi:hypothetical protein
LLSASVSVAEGAVVLAPGVGFAGGVGAANGCALAMAKFAATARASDASVTVRSFFMRPPQSL